MRVNILNDGVIIQGLPELGPFGASLPRRKMKAEGSIPAKAVERSRGPSPLFHLPEPVCLLCACWVLAVFPGDSPLF